MKFVDTFTFYSLIDSTVSFLTAFIFGAIVGVERQYRQRTAGLRTVVLVSIGAAGFVDLAVSITDNEGAVRVISYVVSGIGFLGAGVIMKEGPNVRGLNTAATLWCAAAIGACAGTDMIAEAALLTIFVLATNTLLRPIVEAINRIPLGGDTGEVSLGITVTTLEISALPVQKRLTRLLLAEEYSISSTTVIHKGDGTVEISVTLTDQSIESGILDTIVEEIRTQKDVTQAMWTGNVHQ